MNTQIQDMFTQAQGRYLAQDEVDVLVGWAAQLDQRVAAMTDIQANEERIVNATVAEVMRLHPSFEREHADAANKATRDFAYVLRYCTLAMVRQDSDWLESTLLVWLKTILQAFGMGQVIDTSYRVLPQQAERALRPETTRLLAPYLRLTHAVLTSGEGNRAYQQ